MPIPATVPAMAMPAPIMVFWSIMVREVEEEEDRLVETGALLLRVWRDGTKANPWVEGARHRSAAAMDLRLGMVGILLLREVVACNREIVLRIVIQITGFYFIFSHGELARNLLG